MPFYGFILYNPQEEALFSRRLLTHLVHPLPPSLAGNTEGSAAGIAAPSFVVLLLSVVGAMMMKGVVL